ncbi:DNA repair protein-like protein Rad7 [Acephala macrosclerotiorum]|nr:DNA repair protein-like protein Rad7 [Acephala macrosclerotiorum]
MSAPNPPNPPQRGARAIRGPQSALTDFLASHNISANQIRQDANARRAAALASVQAAGDDSNAPSPAAEPEPAAPPRRKETKAQEAKRKKEEEKAIAKIKASKHFQKRRRQFNSDDEVTDEDEAARAFFQESMAPLPGQMENCEICEKRFSVTAYSRAGPDGGLLCPKCSKDMDKEEGAAKKKRKTQQGRARRQLQSNLLDGIYPGAKDLMTLCIETLAKNVDMAESFGDLPPALVDRLSGILCKKRLMNPSILDLFLRPEYDSITIYDGSKLSSDDYIRIFQIMPKIKHLRLRNAVQFKNEVMDHLLGTTVELESLSLYGANLIDDERWDKYLTEKGSHLKALKVYWTDGHFGNEQLEVLSKTCPDLQRLKVAHNQKVTDPGIAHIANLPNLKYLSLEITNPREQTTSAPYVEVINSIGAGLRTLSLSNISQLDDSVLEAIHKKCKDLSKLRLVDNEVFTDQAFANLFAEWRNLPLVYLDLHKCRHIDAAEPRENPDGVGLGSLGFEALMAHSGQTLKHLNVHSCRHISREAFESVFTAEKTYPELQTIDLSFCQQVNDFIAGSIFRSCPNLKTLKVFGNFGVRDVRVPKGKILIGVPNALGMQIEGTEDGEGRTI